jgi:hypothetical protein
MRLCDPLGIGFVPAHQVAHELVDAPSGVGSNHFRIAHWRWGRLRALRSMR